MRILKEPLLHFVLLGGLLFALYQTFDPQAREPGESEIFVPPGRIEQLSAIFRKTWQRPPTRDELQHLIDDFILEEIYYREATAAGLDQDDTLIRRRLRQKMEFLSDDLARREPDDDELREFVNGHPALFQPACTESFRQIFFNRERTGADAKTAIDAAAAALRGGTEPAGHPTLLPAEMDEATFPQIAGTFGKDFAEALAKLPVGEWSGPVESSFGIHFVHVDARRQDDPPPFEKIRALARREWEHAQRKAFREKFDRELRAKYDITVKWPATENPEG